MDTKTRTWKSPDGTQNKALFCKDEPVQTDEGMTTRDLWQLWKDGSWISFHETLDGLFERAGSRPKANPS